jgi:molybdate transport system substrate-binding protein
MTRAAGRRLLVVLAWSTLAMASARADEIRVAVSANFAEAAKKIAADFEKDTGHTVRLSFGSTGAFYAQIDAGAPFDVLLAADDETPRKLVDEGKGVAETRKTYAIGKLVLWSADPAVVDASGAVLKSDKFKHLAVADARLAPYGKAAQAALEKLGLRDRLKDKMVTAGNIGQALQFVMSGNAEIGFLALGQVQPPDGSKPPGSMWIVPDLLYDPIRQDVVVLTSAKAKAAANEFAKYLASDKARTTIKAYGYGW